MREQAVKLIQATQELVAYIENNQVYDKLSDCGCGLYDTYRTDAFEAALEAAKAAVQEMRAALEDGG